MSGNGEQDYRGGGAMNYVDTFIAVADDCPAAEGVVPRPRGDRKTVAVLQYEMISGVPCTLTQEDVQFESWFAGQEALAEADRERLRAEFLSMPRACLRGSPLPKQYGWGLHFDDRGRVALYGVGSPEYRRFAEPAADGTTVLKALRSKALRSKALRSHRPGSKRV
jgi:hypothetical protein